MSKNVYSTITIGGQKWNIKRDVVIMAEFETDHNISAFHPDQVIEKCKIADIIVLIYACIKRACQELDKKVPENSDEIFRMGTYNEIIGALVELLKSDDSKDDPKKKKATD